MEIEEIKKIAKEGRRDEAIEMLQQMLERNEGEREEVLLDLGAVYYAKGDTTQALYCKDLLNP